MGAQLIWNAAANAGAGGWEYAANPAPQVLICTSTTRPSAPWSGMSIYETDTKLRYLWDGSAWVMIGVKPSVKVLEASSTNQVITASTFTLWAAAATVFDTGDYATPAGGHFTIPITGLYTVSANVTWMGGSLAGRRIVQFETYVAQALGTGTLPRRFENIPDATAGEPGLQLTVDYPLTAGDQVRVVIYQNVGAGYGVDNTNFKSSISIKRVA